MQTQTCEQVDAWLPLYVNGRLSPVERGRVAHHLAECEECQSELGRLFRLRSGFEALAAAHQLTPLQSVRAFAMAMSDQRVEQSVPGEWSGFSLLGERLGPLRWMQALVAFAEELSMARWDVRMGPVTVSLP